MSDAMNIVYAKKVEDLKSIIYEQQDKIIKLEKQVKSLHEYIEKQKNVRIDTCELLENEILTLRDRIKLEKDNKCG